MYELLNKAKNKFIEATNIAPFWLQPKFNQIEVNNNIESNQEYKKMLNEKIFKELEEKYTDPEVIEQLGWSYFIQNDLTRSEEEFQKILNKDKDNIWGLNGLGAIYLNQASYKEAENIFRKILDMEGESPIFLINLALTLVRQPDEAGLAEAEELCKRACEQDNNYGPVYLCLGVINYKRGLLKKSEKYIRSAAEKGVRGSYTDLGALYIQMGEYDKAERSLFNALRRDPNDVQAHLELGKYYLFFPNPAEKTDDQQKKVIERFKKARVLATTDQVDEIDKTLAPIFIRYGQFEEAEKILSKIKTHVDKNEKWQIHILLAHLLLCKPAPHQELRYEKALKHANDAISLKPNHPHPYFYKGIIKYKLGKYKEAVKNLEYSCGKDFPDKNEFYTEAELYTEQAQSMIDMINSGDIPQSMLVKYLAKNPFFIISLVFLFSIILLLFLFLFNQQPNNQGVTIAIIAGITTLSSFIVLILMSPFYKKIKFGSIEAETKPSSKALSPFIEPSLEALFYSIEPTGVVGFGNKLPTITSGPLGSNQYNRPATRFQMWE